MKNTLINRQARSRVVNFRVSPEEMDVLMRAAEGSGSRSVSDFVRQAAFTLAGDHRETAAPGRIPMRAPEPTAPAEGLEMSQLKLLLRAVEQVLQNAPAPAGR